MQDKDKIELKKEIRYIVRMFYKKQYTDADANMRYREVYDEGVYPTAEEVLYSLPFYFKRYKELLESKYTTPIRIHISCISKEFVEETLQEGNE